MSSSSGSTCAAWPDPDTAPQSTILGSSAPNWQPQIAWSLLILAVCRALRSVFWCTVCRRELRDEYKIVTGKCRIKRPHGRSSNRWDWKSAAFCWSLCTSGVACEELNKAVRWMRNMPWPWGVVLQLKMYLLASHAYPIHHTPTHKQTIFLPFWPTELRINVLWKHSWINNFNNYIIPLLGIISC